MMAYKLLTKAHAQGRKLRIVMLEADECCGSATARNGGHCKALAFIGYRKLAAKHGKDVANHIYTFEQRALSQYSELVHEEDIDCDMHVTRTLDVFFVKDDMESAKVDYAARKADFPRDVEGEDLLLHTDPAELERLTGVKDALMAASWPAGHLWPYKLAVALIRISIGLGINLQTHTPALKMERSGSQWQIKTSRGNILAPQVVAASNAYTSSFLPEFEKLIIPVKGTVCSITPPPSHTLHSPVGPLRYTYGLRHGLSNYMIPRQGRGRITGKGDQSIILGGAKPAYFDDLSQWYNNRDDSEQLPGAQQYFQGYMQKHFKEWNGDASNVDYVWSGVQGYSSDMMPLIGPHPERPGVYVIAGYTGHGMPRIPGCTEALACLILDKRTNGEAHTSFAAALPKPWLLTSERLRNKQNTILSAVNYRGAKEVTDETVMMEMVKSKL